MSSCEIASASARITTQPAIVTRVAGGIAAWFRAWQNRRAFYRLGEMTDTELADIGLTRGDLHVAIAVPFGSDPTVKLHTLASQRAATAADLARSIR